MGKRKDDSVLLGERDGRLKKQRRVMDEDERKKHISRNLWLRHTCIYNTTGIIASAAIAQK